MWEIPSWNEAEKIDPAWQLSEKKYEEMREKTQIPSHKNFFKALATPEMIEILSFLYLKVVLQIAWMTWITARHTTK